MIALEKNIKKSASDQRTYPRIYQHIISFYSLYLAQTPDPNAPKGIQSNIFKNIGKLFGADPTDPSKARGPSSATTIGGLITYIVQILLVVAGSIAVIFLIVGAYRYIVAHGNEEQMESAKKTMTSAIVGLVIVALAFAVITIILNILISGPGGTGLIGK